jgi:transcriptional regulator with XRE-family HTH domain
MPIRPKQVSDRQLQLRDARTRVGLSIDRVAHEAGIERSRLWRGEHGYIQLPDVELDALEAVLAKAKP